MIIHPIIDTSQTIKSLKEQADILDEQFGYLCRIADYQIPTYDFSSLDDEDLYKPKLFSKYLTNNFKERELSKKAQRVRQERIKLIRIIDEIEKDDLFKEKYEIRRYFMENYTFRKNLDTDSDWRVIVKYYLEGCIANKLEENIEFTTWRISNTGKMVNKLEDGQKEEAKVLITQFTRAKKFLQKVLSESKEEY